MKSNLTKRGHKGRFNDLLTVGTFNRELLGGLGLDTNTKESVEVIKSELDPIFIFFCSNI
ncbi:hypothetical protein [Bacillus andreraoultii]|uniref:hypothetical protein n=1 Tax=Bacillus andreraoultii TaxID=1499685 RepID=UPI001111F8CF|nr:hypothetical protein [Bacillus andreraoultii]